jgi:hypothetical protein
VKNKDRRRGLAHVVIRTVGIVTYPTSEERPMTNLTTTGLPTGQPTDLPTGAATASGPPIDLYREVHKGLRVALSDLVREVGSLDAGDAESVAVFSALFADIDMMLATHHAHEDGGRLGELIAQHVDADVVWSIHEAHDRFEAMLHDLRVAVAALSSGGTEIGRAHV